MCGVARGWSSIAYKSPRLRHCTSSRSTPPTPSKSTVRSDRSTAPAWRCTCGPRTSDRRRTAHPPPNQQAWPTCRTDRKHASAPAGRPLPRALGTTTARNPKGSRAAMTMTEMTSTTADSPTRQGADRPSHAGARRRRLADRHVVPVGVPGGLPRPAATPATDRGRRLRTGRRRSVDGTGTARRRIPPGGVGVDPRTQAAYPHNLVREVEATPIDHVAENFVEVARTRGSILVQC